MRKPNVCELIGSLPDDAKELVTKLISHLAANCAGPSGEEVAEEEIRDAKPTARSAALGE